jgi:hypothetical protein
MRNRPITLALAVVMTANVGCCSSSCRNWLHRGSPCGTTLAAPAVMAAPVVYGAPLQAPQAAPAMAPFMAPAPMQQVMPPQQMMCCPQQIPCCPQPIPCCPPMQYDPCPGGYMSGSYMEGDISECGPMTSYDEGYLVPGSETPVDSESGSADPRPAPEN